jgi:hypothetical protein
MLKKENIFPLSDIGRITALCLVCDIEITKEIASPAIIFINRILVFLDMREMMCSAEGINND